MKALPAICGLCVLLLLPSWVFAQTPSPTYEVKIYAKGAIAPTQTFPIAAYTCDLAAPAATSPVNPVRLWWNDEAHPGKFCQYVDVATGPFLSRPVGDYEATLTRIVAADRSAESARVPFSRQLPPGVPTGLIFSR